MPAIKAPVRLNHVQAMEAIASRASKTGQIVKMTIKTDFRETFYPAGANPVRVLDGITHLFPGNGERVVNNCRLFKRKGEICAVPLN